MIQVYFNIVRMSPTDANEAETACRFWNSRGYLMVGAIYRLDGFGSNYIHALTTSCADFNIEVVASGFDENTKESGIDFFLGNFLEKRLQIFIYVGIGDDFGLLQPILQTSFELGLLSNISSWMFAEPSSIGQFENASMEVQKMLNGSLVVGPYIPPVMATIKSMYLTTLNFSSPEMKHMPDQNSQLFTSGILESYFEEYGGMVYDAVIAAGFMACKTSPSSLYEARETVVFNGLSGNVQFDSIGNRKQMAYDISVSRLTDSGFVLQKSLSFEKDNWTSIQDLFYNGGSTEIPSNSIPIEENMNYLSTLRNQMCYFMGIFSTTMSLVFILWTIFYRFHVVVVTSQVKFLSLIAFGGFLSSYAIFSLLKEDSGDGLPANSTGGNESATRDCKIALWLWCIGFMITFGSLFGKTWRIFKLYQITSKDGKPKIKKHIILSDGVLFALISGMILVDVIVLLVWEMVSPVYYQRVISHQTGPPFYISEESYGKCTSDAGHVFVPLLIFIHGSVLVFGNYVGYLTVGVSTVFSERKYISIAMVSALQVYAIGLTAISVLDPRSSSVLLFLQVIMIFFNNVCIQFLVFVPKMLRIHTTLYENETITFFETSTAPQSRSPSKINPATSSNNYLVT